MKLVLGIALGSAWLLLFGGYYLVLVLAKAFLLQRYSWERLERISAIQLQRHLLLGQRIGGGSYVLLGAVFTGICGWLYRSGVDVHYSKNVTLVIATIGFVKFISAVVGLIRARHLDNAWVRLLKAFNVANGSVAIVLTQYALLEMQRSAAATSSTGLFGMGVGVVLMVVGGMLMRQR
ncbi:hypothetical protein [Secundilactobacillus similis]|uniref:hypothetical protein n=1 Tax=Secundilactobacillus similis TaxID=414682 RepID=UPI0012E0DDE1|nr:hypothetical protein [Secundilactobacillus similis]